MTLLSRLRSVLRNLLRKQRIDADLDDEIEAYRRLLADQRVRDGMSPLDARRIASLDLGGAEQVKEQVRQSRSGHHLEVFWQDLRYAVRRLGKTPGFTAVAALTLGLGVGANSAIFSVIDTVLLKGLPLEQADRLAVIQTNYKEGKTTVTSWKDFEDWKARAKSFDRMALYDHGSTVISAGGDASVMRSASAGPDFFEMAGVRPVLGELFSRDQCETNAAPVIALSESFWKGQFGGDPKILGTSLKVDGKQSTIVGVIPDKFDAFMEGRVQIWTPLQSSIQQEGRQARHLFAAGLLRSGVPVNQASKEMASLAADLQRSYPDSEGWGASVLSLRESIVGDSRPMLLILMGAVGAVLLIASANIANLMLARGAARRKELAVRAALGAGRMRLLRQVLSEGLAISGLGAGVALLLAVAAVKGFTQLAPADIPRLDEIAINWTVIGFTVLIAFGSNLIFGLLPAVRLSSAESAEALKESGRGIQGERHRSRLRRLIVISELAIALVLLIGCGLLVRSFRDVALVKPGFNPDNAVEAQISLPGLDYKTDESRLAFYNRLSDQLKTLPAESAAICSRLPLKGSNFEYWGFVNREGVPRSPQTVVGEQSRPVSPGYFAMMGIPLLGGRDFSQFDSDPKKPVVILSRTLARQLWGDERAAVGHRILFDVDQPAEVVGVVGDVKSWGLEDEGDPGAYAPMAMVRPDFMVVVARARATSADRQAAVDALIQSIRETVRSIDRGLPVSSVQTLNQLVDQSMARRKFYLGLISVLGALSFVLAAIGAYGVISYSVAERIQEIGVRVALGATPKEILSLVVGQGLRLSLVAVTLGLGAALLLTPVLKAPATIPNSSSSASDRGTQSRFP